MPTTDTRFKSDKLKSPEARNRALIRQLMGAWGGMEILAIARVDTASASGWLVTFAVPDPD